MMKRMRQLALRKNQKGLAIVEYVIVLAVVAALAAYVFGSGDSSLKETLKDSVDKSTNTIKNVGENQATPTPPAT